jgi:ribonuclease G
MWPMWHRQENGDAPMFARKNEPPVPIEKQVFEGQSIMVQVIKDPIGTKGRACPPRSASPGGCWCSCRRTTTSASRRKSLGRARCAARPLQALVGTKEKGGGGGFILRTNGEDASDAELAEDIAYLRKTWARIKDAPCACRPCRCCTRI